MHVVDSHTAGEPTRVIVRGGPMLGGPLSERVVRFRRDFDRFRAAVVHEPRGSDVVVGALLGRPHDPTCAAGVVFFNNVGYLGMCGHGTIGVVATLAHLGRIKPGIHRIETPVGIVATQLHKNGLVSVENVPSYRKAKGVRLDVEGIGPCIGDVAWGGNWFFLAQGFPLPLTLPFADQLIDVAWKVRQAVNAAGYPEVDHVEFFGPPANAGNHSRNFVLCPGKTYDRSPCGTGTSAKLACLAADGKLQPGETWIQESMLGTTFAGSYQWLDQATGHIAPTISGRAYVNAESTLILNEADPFCWGIAAQNQA
ncbi:MAG: proline racemase family protein [Gemmataceae bacterium]|nr:proline racemase family protein [Gemmataceae bacterium]